MSTISELTTTAADLIKKYDLEHVLSSQDQLTLVNILEQILTTSTDKDILSWAMFYKSRVLSGMFFNPPIPGLTHFQEARYIRACQIVDTWTKDKCLISIHKRDLLDDVAYLLQVLDKNDQPQYEIRKWCIDVLNLVKQYDNSKRDLKTQYVLPPSEELLHIERVELITEAFNINKFSFVPSANRADFMQSIHWLVDNSVSQATKDWAKEVLQLTK